MGQRVLVVHAHPDGETVWTGATIARLIADGGAVVVLTATRGEHDPLLPEVSAGAPDEVATLRERELTAALAELGVTDHRFLGAADARWGQAPRRYRGSGEPQAVPAPDALVAADPAEVAADIASVIADVRPDLVLGYGPDGIDGHPDRRVIGENARWAAKVMGVPYFEIVPARGLDTVTVDDPAALATRARALRAYVSRIAVGDETYSFPSGAPRRLDVGEHHRRVRAQPTGFASFGLGARIIACAFALILGAFAGLALTVAHQSVLRVGEVTVPWGVIAALALSAALLAGLRLVYVTRLVAGAAAIGLLGVITVLSLSGGGSVIVPDNDAGRVWTIGVVLVAAVVLAWPRIERRGGGRMKSPAAKGSEQP